MPTRSANASETRLLDVQTIELDMLANAFMRVPKGAVATFALEARSTSLPSV